MANVKISELNEITKSQTAYDDYLPLVDTSANETKKISVENLTANNVYLLAVVKPNGQVPTPETGAKYYSESTNKIYYAPDDEHWYEYGTPIEGLFYIVVGEKGNYVYDSENQTLVSVGGGSGSQVVVAPDEVTEDTKLYIEASDLEPQYERLDMYSTDEVKTNKVWIDGKPIYRKVITGTTPTTTNSLLYSDSNIDVLVNSYGIVKTQSTSTERWMNVNSYSNNGEYNNIIFIPNTGLYFMGAYVLGMPYKITIEYTKTN